MTPSGDAMSQPSKPKLSNKQVLDYLEQHFGLHGTLNTLPSYSDLNFVLRSDQQLFVVKVANASDLNITLDMQNKAMQHLRLDGLAVPAVVQSKNGSDISTIKNLEENNFYLRVLTYLPGEFYSDASAETHGKKLWNSLGDFLGRIDSSLEKFDHQGAYRYSEWDLAQGLGVCQSKKFLLEKEQLGLVDYFLERYQINVLPVIKDCPQGIIHNDANDYNLLVDNPKAPNSISGLIDFGDMIFSHLINELAIACAYAILEQPDPLVVIKEVARGYHQQRPLNETEIGILYHLVGLRLCTSICNAALAIKNEPDNKYLVVSVVPAIKALKKLKTISVFSVEKQLLVACNLSPIDSFQHQDIIDYRQRHLARSLSLSYKQPIKIVKGEGAYLFDENGMKYLDMVNNVCHVGHCHPEVVFAGQKQMAMLNTNTRYLHDNIVNFSRKLLATFPDSLSVCMFVNSGSEANELAFRLAQAYTNSKELIVVDGAYHGNTAACVEASPYKFNGPGGKGPASHIHVVKLPDPYRGRYQGNQSEIGEIYAKDVSRAIEEIQSREKSVGAYICESLQGVAGQIIMPDGYLKSVYKSVRQAGGVCIADEVQVGFGRAGEYMWAFETQGVVPDIVTLGKPIGNGHPLAAVIMRKEIADSFANGMEFFNTFGGNPVSCAIGEAVLDVIEKESLQSNAQVVGHYMREQLRDLQQRFEIIGDVRGVGLFNGVELVTDRKTKEPATAKMNWLIEYFKTHQILLTSEGPFYNILKIKPPIVFSKENTEHFLMVLESGLSELEKRDKNETT